MPDKDYFVVYHYEFDKDGAGGDMYGAHIFTSSATTRWELYAEHLQNRLDRARLNGQPWSDMPNVICRTFDAKVNKLN